MNWLSVIPAEMFLLFTLVLVRMSGLVMTAPVYGSQEVPPQIRAFLAFSLALLIAPTQWGVTWEVPRTLVDYLLLVGRELLIGVALGVGIQMFFTAAQLAGQMISQQSGASLASIFNPTLETEMPLHSQFLYLLSLAVFVGIGGHRLVMGGLLGSLATLPLGRMHVPDSMFTVLTGLLGESLELGFRIAAPTTTAVLLATFVLVLIGRTLPQLNINSIGFSLNVGVTLITLSLSLAAAGWLFQTQIDPLWELLLEGLEGG
jgi:flagellar biosynthetic protein FliR